MVNVQLNCMLFLPCRIHGTSDSKASVFVEVMLHFWALVSVICVFQVIAVVLLVGGSGVCLNSGIRLAPVLLFRVHFAE